MSTQGSTTAHHSHLLQHPSPDGIVALFIGLWTVLNVVIAACTDLCGDEAYYWSWIALDGAHLDWGYFDHPPLVALLISLTYRLGGTLGVRLASLLLQPAYIWMLWLIVRPAAPSRRDALLFSTLAFALPALQLYGFLALPDAPLLFFTVLFLLVFKHYLRQPTLPLAIALSIIIALLGYSKYHGLLVVALVLISSRKVLRSRYTYLALAIALLLYMPHLLWQHAHHWCTLHYHILERHNIFIITNPIMVLVNLVLIANPLFAYHYYHSLRPPSPAVENESDNDDTPLSPAFLRTLRFIVIGFTAFFFAAAFRGYTQAQWLLPAVVALLILLCNHTFRHPSTHRNLLATGALSAVVFIAARIVLLCQPTDLRIDLLHNRKQAQQLSAIADSRPIIINGYARAAQYAFYTGQPVACLRPYDTHLSQWNLRDDEASFLGLDVVVESCHDTIADSTMLVKNTKFRYRTAHNYRPHSRIAITADHLQTHPGTDSATLTCRLRCYNPYDYTLQSAQHDSLSLAAFFYIDRNAMPLTHSSIHFTLPPHDTTTILCHFPVPRRANGHHITIAFGIDATAGTPPRQSPHYPLTIDY